MQRWPPIEQHPGHQIPGSIHMEGYKILKIYESVDY